jgi:hypothetical protein
MRKYQFVSFLILTLLTVLSCIIVFIKYQHLRNDCYDDSKTDTDILQLVKNNYLISSEIESIKLSKNLILHSNSGDSITIRDLMRNGDYVIMWVSKGFCDSCVYETISLINSLFTEKLKTRFVIVQAHSDRSSIDLSSVSTRFYLAKKENSDHDLVFSIPAFLFLADSCLNVKSGIVIDSR